jgi:membrane protease YdiL (CAAX protease family)
MQAHSNTVAIPSAPATRRRVDAGVDRPAGGRPLKQLGVGRIAAVWAAAAIPMGVLSWVVAPRIADQLSGSGALARGMIIALTAGLVWQFVLVMTLVAREQGTLRWSVLKEALRIQRPESPRSGRRGGRVWLVLVPFILAAAAVQMLPGAPIPASRDMGEFLSSTGGQEFMSGAWGWFALMVTMWIFNTVLGEELLFRGYLLPRMSGTFGERDWVANGVIFAVYHLHVPWAMTGSLLTGFLYAKSSKRYRSTLMGIAIHSAESVFFTVLVLGVVLKG